MGQGGQLLDTGHKSRTAPECLAECRQATHGLSLTQYPHQKDKNGSVTSLWTES